MHFSVSLNQTTISTWSTTLTSRHGLISGWHLSELAGLRKAAQLPTKTKRTLFAIRLERYQKSIQDSISTFHYPQSFEPCLVSESAHPHHIIMHIEYSIMLRQKKFAKNFLLKSFSNIKTKLNLRYSIFYFLIKYQH